MDIIPRNVPWRDWNEWFQAKHAFFPHATPTNPSMRSRRSVSIGIQTVNAWRVRGGLPHSVESTACLMEIEYCGPLCDKNDDSNEVDDVEEKKGEMEENQERGDNDVIRSGIKLSPQRSEMELRMTYSLAIIRAVNGLVDPSQKGLYADSIMSIAVARGLPSWIVELRHDSTHNQLPALNVLRSASNHLIQWFYENYWEVQSQHISTYLDALFETTVEGVTSSLDSPEDRAVHEVINSNAMESICDICPTGITGPLMARVLENGLRAESGTNKLFDEGTLNNLCNTKNTTIIDTFIARLVKHALDLVQEIDDQEMQQKSVVEELNQCRRLLSLAEQPWRDMHEEILSNTSSKETFYEKRTPSKLLHYYWNSLLMRAKYVTEGLEERVAGKGDALNCLLSILNTFKCLNEYLERYDYSSKSSPSSTPVPSRKRKRNDSTDRGQPLPEGWTILHGEKGGSAWPVGMDPSHK